MQLTQSILGALGHGAAGEDYLVSDDFEKLPRVPEEVS
jgi:hypothetical protein